MLGLSISQAAVSQPAIDRGVWHCTFTEKIQCAARRECEPMPSSFNAVLNSTAGTYSRCLRGFDICTSAEARFTSGDGFLIAEVSGNATFAKLANDLTVTEVTTLGSTVLISRGRCAQARPL